MTTEELRLEQEEAERKEKEHAEWRKEKDWFISLPRNPFYDGEAGDIILTLEELKNALENYGENYEKTKYSGKVEFLYKTNGWKEDLQELD